MKSDTSSRETAIRQLIKSTLGHLSEWSKPEIENTVGPYEPDVFDSFDQQRSKLEEQCLAVLSNLSDDDIDVLVNPKTPHSNELKRRWEEVFHSEVTDLSQAEPPWYAGGFGVSSYRADFHYWSQLPTFTLKEALLLSLGVEPKHFTLDKIDGLQVEADHGIEPWAPLVYLLARRLQLTRQFPSLERGKKVSARDLFAWIAVVELDIHPDFTSKYLVAPSERTPELEKARLDHREKSSMLQLIIAMAVGGYVYVPGEKRSQVPKEIESDAAKLGIDVTSETIRKYLRSAEGQISDDWTPPES